MSNIIYEYYLLLTDEIPFIIAILKRKRQKLQLTTLFTKSYEMCKLQTKNNKVGCILLLKPR